MTDHSGEQNHITGVQGSGAKQPGCAHSDGNEKENHS